MKKTLLLLIVLCLTLYGGCTEKKDNSAAHVIGNVTIVSGGEEYTSLENWIYTKEKNGPAADGARKQAEEVAGELVSIPYMDDFHIVIDGEPQEYKSYSLYNGNFEQVYYRESEFSAPQDNGEYILFIELVWGDEENYTGYQYCFKLSVYIGSEGEGSAASAELDAAFVIDTSIYAEGSLYVDIIEGKTFVDLTQEGNIEVGSDELSNYQLCTNSTKITVTIPRGECEGTFWLYNTQHYSDFIMSFDLNQQNRSKTFTNLTSAFNYYIIASESLEDALITVTD